MVDVHRYSHECVGIGIDDSIDDSSIDALAATARLGLVATCSRTDSSCSKLTVYYADDDGVQVLFTAMLRGQNFGSGHVVDLAFTDSPLPDEPPLLVAGTLMGNVFVIDVSRFSLEYVGLIPVHDRPRHYCSFQDDDSVCIRTRGRLVGVREAVDLNHVKIFEGYGAIWELKHRILVWNPEFIREVWYRGVFCLEGDGSVVTVRVDIGYENCFLEDCDKQLVLVDCEGNMTVCSNNFSADFVHAIVPCHNDGWLVYLDFQYVYHVPAGWDGTYILPNIITVPDFGLGALFAYMPSNGMFFADEDGLKAWLDTRRMSVLRKAWCSVVVRGIMRCRDA